MNASESASLVKSIINHQGFIALFSALLGAIVGSVTGYLFNRQLEKQKAKERYWIQRKNTIYSPIYKELLALRDYLVRISDSKRPFIDIEFEENGYASRTLIFSIWNLVKKDVRYDYVPDNLKQLLDKLIFRLQQQMSLQDLLNANWKNLSERFLDENKNDFDEEKMKGTNVAAGLDRYINELYFPYDSPTPRENLKSTFIKSYLKKDAEVEIERIALKLEKGAKRVKEYRILKKELSKLINYAEKTVKEFRIFITKIIANYEGGVNIE